MEVFVIFIIAYVVKAHRGTQWKPPDPNYKILGYKIE